MVDLEQNLDAYRILAQILRDLRATLRVQLEKRHGQEWFRVGLPESVLDHLIERKEKEKAIDWYENEYQQLIDYASFSDILEIIEANPDILPQLKSVTPSQPLLHARMMELEIMREKLAMARPISEAELAFLGTFHLRIRRALEAPATGEVQPEKKEKPALQAVPEPEPAKETNEGEPTGQAPQDEEPPKEEGDQQERPAKKRRAPKMKTRVGSTRSFKGAAPAATAAAQTPLVTEEELEEPEENAAVASSTANSLAIALDEGDNITILRALYKEVTALAEGLWSSDAPPSPAVWRRVREHRWYEENFSPLGLKPLSDFYEILDRINQCLHDGLPKDELQQILKENNFAKVLLALRDMFQKNRI